MNDVLYLPDLKKNVLLVRAMTPQDALVEFAGGECKISRNGKLLAIGQLLTVQHTVSWCSKKQNTVAKSTTEAEYVAVSFATQDVIWLRHLLANIGMKAEGPSTIFYDNNSGIEPRKKPKFHDRTKHIDVAHHFVREQVTLINVQLKICWQIE